MTNLRGGSVLSFLGIVLISSLSFIDISHGFLTRDSVRLGGGIHPSRMPSLRERSPEDLEDKIERKPSENRRLVLWKTFRQVASVSLLVASWTRPAWAETKSRTEGYDVQKSEDEWKQQLSPIQYQILRKGGTEKPGYSILNEEKREGTFECVACGTPLFSSKDKFNSGTGWPSFARPLEGVEIEEINPVSAALGTGAELRCKTCGGHLGDVFKDGKIFIGTEAFQTGERYCIDGVALRFLPTDGSSPLLGDLPLRNRGQQPS